MKQNLDRILCLFFFISNKRVNRFVINVFFSLTKGSFLLRRLFMQTKNMRLLKASVLCLSIALLKQTGHAGIAEDIAAADPSKRTYTGVEMLDEAAIKPYSQAVAAIGMDWLLAAQTPLVNQNLDKQRNHFLRLFPSAFGLLQDKITNNSAMYLNEGLKEGLTAMASGNFKDVKDVSEAEVQRVMGNIAKGAEADIYHNYANFLVQKALFEFAKVAQKVSKAKPQEQPGLLGLIACNMQESGLSQYPVVFRAFEKLSHSLQQSSASAAAPQPPTEQERQSQQETTAEKQLKALGAKWAGAVVPQDQMQQEMQQAFDLARNISQIPGRNTPALQTILTSVDAGLKNEAYKNDPAGAVNTCGALKDILKACGIQVSPDTVDGARGNVGDLIGFDNN